MNITSHPSRVRGLKYQLATEKLEGGRMSHPSRVRGLKLEKAGIVEDDGYVAPFTGAWIEIRL